ncbi:MAG: 3-oxoadipate enol-lactonase [bacterium]|jgi:3-oxoadipate enol-lactonase
MYSFDSNGVTLHVRDEGPRDGRVIMFSNSLGTDLRVWDLLIPLLPNNLRIVRYDKRGHGLSDCPDAPYHMDSLVDDALCVIDTLGAKDITFVGLSVGGLIGQGVAARRPELLQALVLMDTAAKIGTAEMWADRIAAVEKGGLANYADSILDRWFSEPMRHDKVNLSPWQNMLVRTPLAGYLGTSAAIAASDMTSSTSELTLPVMALVGEHDGATNPDLVRGTAELCGADFHIIANAGHLPCVERPEQTAIHITDFLEKTG